MAAARAAQAGGRARIPIGRIASGTQVNAGWSWHLEDVSFVEVAIELCDGRPSDVERQGIQQLRNISTLPWLHELAVMSDVLLGKGATVG